MNSDSNWGGTLCNKDGTWSIPQMTKGTTLGTCACIHTYSVPAVATAQAEQWQQ